MSSQEKKNFLMRYRDCEREIVWLEEEIARWQSRAERITAGYSPTPGAHGETRDRVQEAVCEMAELRGALYDRLLDAAAVRREIERAIASLGEERLRLLLEYRYIDGLTLEAAAERMHYSWRQAANLHRQALSELELEPLPRRAS